MHRPPSQVFWLQIVKRKKGSGKNRGYGYSQAYLLLRQGGLWDDFFIHQVLSFWENTPLGSFRIWVPSVREVVRVFYFGVRDCLTRLAESSFKRKSNTRCHPAAQLILIASAHGAADPLRLTVPGARLAASSARGFAGVKP